MNGSWTGNYPLKVIYCAQVPPSACHKVGVSVSKKIFKRAVDRNYIKRLLRECYRLHKKELYEIMPEPCFFMFIYTGKEIIPFRELEKKYFRLLEKIKISGT
jgi:ribonuclease P protein component